MSDSFIHKTMKFHFRATCLSILLVFLGITSSDGIHLPLDSLSDQNLINSSPIGPIEIVPRGVGKVQRFNGTKGPVYIKYTQEKLTDVTSLCFQSLSHCTNFLIKFWVKLNLETPISNPERFIHHGQSSDEEKGHTY